MKFLPSWLKKEREGQGPHLPCHFLHIIRLPLTLDSGYVPPFQKRRAVEHDWQLGWCGIEAAELKGKACDSVAGLCSKYHLWPCESLSEWGLRGDPGNGEITAPFWHGNTSRTPRSCWVEEHLDYLDILLPLRPSQYVSENGWTK